MFSASTARCSGLRSQRCPGRQSASGWRICQRGMIHPLTSSPLSQSLEGSSIWWSLRRFKKKKFTVRNLLENQVAFCIQMSYTMKKRTACNWKKEGELSYLIWTAFLSVGKSCCRRRKRWVWWVPEKQEETIKREINIKDTILIFMLSAQS